jgi:hypothetical protein
MKDNLAPSPFHIKKKTISGLCDAMPFRYILGRHQQFRQDGPIGLVEVINTSDMFFGHD